MTTRTHVACIVSTMLAGVILLPQQPLAAQTLDTFSTIAFQANLNDRVVAVDATGHMTSGRLLRLTSDALVINTAEGPHTLPGAEVTSLVVRTRHVRSGILIGAASGAGAGALAACAGSDRSECGDGALMAGALGAGLGALVGTLLTHDTRVYQIPEQAGVSSTPSVVGAAADMLLRVNLGDQVRVQRRSGADVSGRLRGVSSEELLVVSGDAESRVAIEAVQRLSVRRFQPARGAVIGAAAFAVLALAAPACRDNHDCSPLAAAGFGAGVGMAVGALLPRMVPIFPNHATHTAWSPTLGHDRVGVGASLRW